TFFFQAEDGIRDRNVTGVQTCALPILPWPVGARMRLVASDPTRLHPERHPELLPVTGRGDLDDRDPLAPEPQAITRAGIEREPSRRSQTPCLVSVDHEADVHLAHVRTEVAGRVRPAPRAPRLGCGEILQEPSDLTGPRRQLQRVLSLAREEESAPVVVPPRLQVAQPTEGQTERSRDSDVRCAVA